MQELTLGGNESFDFVSIVRRPKNCLRGMNDICLHRHILITRFLNTGTTTADVVIEFRRGQLLPRS
jgi:hypothetical protein